MGLNEDHHPKIKQLAISCDLFLMSALMGIRDKGTWLVVEGNTGSGKSHCAKRLRTFYNGSKIEFWDGSSNHVPNAVWCFWPHVVDWDDDVFDEFMVDVSSARLVILDDAGAETDRYKAGTSTMRLVRILERCESKWLFMTTNVDSEQWKDRWDQRVADRLNAANRVTLFDVPSYRGSK